MEKRNTFAYAFYARESKKAKNGLSPVELSISVNGSRCLMNLPYRVRPEGVEVLKRNDYQLHIISNQKYNSYLGAIATLCGINKNLTTHMARKTFGQRLLSSGVRMEVVSRALGHRNIKITQSYYCDVQRNDVIREIKQVMI